MHILQAAVISVLLSMSYSFLATFRRQFSFLPRPCSISLHPDPCFALACLPPCYMLGRWQLLPAYAGSVALVIGLWSVGVALILLAIALLITAPLPVIRGLLGKYSVGVVDFEAEVDGAKVIGRWLYPSQPHQSSALYVALPRAGLTAAFVGTATPPALRRFLPRWVLSHWNCVAIPAKRGAALAKSCESMPVVLFSHGLTGALSVPPLAARGASPHSHAVAHTGTREVSQSLGLTLAAAGALVCSALCLAKRKTG